MRPGPPPLPSNLQFALWGNQRWRARRDTYRPPDEPIRCRGFGLRSKLDMREGRLERR